MPNVGVTQPILQLHRNKYLELENEVVLSNQSNASDSQITDVFVIVQNLLGVHGAVL